MDQTDCNAPLAQCYVGMQIVSASLTKDAPLYSKRLYSISLGEKKMVISNTSGLFKYDTKLDVS